MEIKKDLLNEASKKLGISSEKILDAAKTGNVDSILNNLDEKTVGKIKGILNDKEAIEKLMKSPQAQEFLKNFSDK